MPITDSSVLSAALRAYYERSLLMRMIPFLAHCRDAQPARIPRGSGKQVNFRRYGSLAVATTPLTEGTPPAGKSLSVTSITADVEQFGDFVSLSDVVQTQLVDPIIEEAIAVLGEQAGNTVDQLMRDVQAAGTNVLYAGGKSARNQLLATDKMTVVLSKLARRTLELNNVPRFPDGYYHAKIHPSVAFDLTEDSRWIDAKKFASPSELEQGLLGEMEGIRYWQTTNGKKFAGAGSGGADVYATLIYGPNAFGCISYDAPESGGIDPAVAESPYVLPVEIKIKPLGSGGTADPLDQVATLGWKVAIANKRINEAAMVRVESGATA